MNTNLSTNGFRFKKLIGSMIDLMCNHNSNLYKSDVFTFLCKTESEAPNAKKITLTLLTLLLKELHIKENS